MLLKELDTSVKQREIGNIGDEVGIISMDPNNKMQGLWTIINKNDTDGIVVHLNGKTRVFSPVSNSEGLNPPAGTVYRPMLVSKKQYEKILRLHEIDVNNKIKK
jgi:hypothetical protein